MTPKQPLMVLEPEATPLKCPHCSDQLRLFSCAWRRNPFAAFYSVDCPGCEETFVVEVSAVRK